MEAPISHSSAPSRTRTAFSSMWNSFKHGFHSTFGTKFSHNSPICLLGQFYHIKMDDTPSRKGSKNDPESSDSIPESVEMPEPEEYIDENDELGMAAYAFDRFKADFSSRIWLTYRRDFPTISKSSLTSDTGWGCMIRSGQMIIAQALVNHFLGRDWLWKNRKSSSRSSSFSGSGSVQNLVQSSSRANSSQSMEDSTEAIHRMIIKWFQDDPDPNLCPFSIHELVKFGHKMDKKPGDWFGPSSIAFVLKAAIEKASENIDELSDVCCYIAQDCTIYLQDLLELCTSSSSPTSSLASTSTSGHEYPSPGSSGDFSTPSSSAWKSVIILIPARLGTKYFNPLYSPHVKQILSLPQCIGIIGGKPRHSLYFVGFQDDKLIYLDPHYPQKAMDPRELTGDRFNLESFHCHVPRKASFHSIDPSCAIGFYIKSREEFDEFLEGIQQIVEHTRQANDYPVFIVNDGRACQFENDFGTEKEEDQVLRMKYRMVDSMGNVQKIISSEEFILL